MGIDYRPYTRADEEQILHLLRLSMKMDDFPDLQGFWRWKHYQNPFGESPGLVAVDGEKVVGVRVFLRWQWRAGDRVLRAVRAVDTATHPEWERRGIFQGMTLGMVERLTAEGVDFIFNTPNQFSMPGYLKMGWTHVGRLPLRLKVRRPFKVARTVAGGGGLGGATAITRAADNSPVLELLADPAVRALVETAGEVANPGLHTALSPAYLEWRYGHNRWYGYRAAFEQHGPSAALVVCRPNRRGRLNELLVDEVITHPAEGGRLLAVRMVDGLARSTDADYVAVSGLDPAALRLGGFRLTGRWGPDLTVRPLQPDLPVDPRSFGSWSAGFGDLELF